jgi:hypothetical protein
MEHQCLTWPLNGGGFVWMQTQAADRRLLAYVGKTQALGVHGEVTLAF